MLTLRYVYSVLLKRYVCRYNVNIKVCIFGLVKTDCVSDFGGKNDGCDWGSNRFVIYTYAVRCFVFVLRDLIGVEAMIFGDFFCFVGFYAAIR